MTGQSSGGGERERRERWRATAVDTARSERIEFHPQRLAGWILASIATLACLAAITIWPWLFARRTAVVQLSIDDSQNALVAPLPYGRNDVEAIQESLKGRLSPQLEGRRPKTLDYRTAQAMRGQLRPEIEALKLTARDSLIAVIRGQMLVAVDAAGAQQACLLATDVDLSRGGQPVNIVSCQEVIEALSSSPAATTLIVLDMGDLRWDPRLGVIAGIVPTQLDEEVRRWAVSGDCWVLGSHDTEEFSGVSIIDRRGIFLRAVELGLAGRADDRQWGGDGDREVELHELARFVAAWTNAWSRRESGFEQQPVLWRVGGGRVALDKVPQGLRLVSAGRPHDVARSEPPRSTTVPTEEPDPPPAPPTLDATNASPTAGETAGPEPIAVMEQDIIWELVEETGSSGFCNPVDYAPHLWRKTVSLSAAISAARGDDSPQAERFADLERKLADDLRHFGKASLPRGDDNRPLARLEKARQRASTEFLDAWKNGDKDLRDALASRNRAFELAAAAVAYCGSAAGSQVAGGVARKLPGVIEAIAALHEELVRLSLRARPDESRDKLRDLQARLETEEYQLKKAVAEASEQLILGLEQNRGPMQTADIRWLMASRLPTAGQRGRLGRAVTDYEQAYHPPIPAAAGAAESPQPRRLHLEGEGFSPPGSRREPDWDGVADRLNRTVRLLGTLGPVPAAGSVEWQQSEDMLRGLPAGSDTVSRTVAAAGQGLARILDALPGTVGHLLNEEVSMAAYGTKATEIDALLRLSDPRDADRMPHTALGWSPRTAVSPLDLVIKAEDASLEVGKTRKLAIALLSGEALPDDGTLTLEFDPSRLEVRLPGGRTLAPGQPIAVKNMDSRMQAEVSVRPLGRVAADDPNRSGFVTAELAARGNQGRAKMGYELPVMEQLEIAIRGRRGTVRSDQDRDGWSAIVVDPLAVDAAAEPGSPWPETFKLRPFPGQVTGWEVAITNQTGEQRAVTVDLVSVGENSAERPANPGQSPGWQAFITSLERSGKVPSTARVVAASGPLRLPAEPTRVCVTLDLVGPTAVGEQTEGKEAQPQPVDSTLAIVVRDLDTEPTSAADGDAAATAKSLVRPPESQRSWLGRLDLTPRRPSGYLSATIMWTADERSLAMTVKPRDLSLLPDKAIRVRATPLRHSSDSTGNLLRLSKREARISQASPEGTLLGTWNGEDDIPVDVAIEIDGYPRAFVLRADCRPVMSGVPQRPQRDWRQVEFLEPDEDYRPFKSEAEVSVRLAIDLPEDTPAEGVPPIALVADVGRVEDTVWRSGFDRQTDYTLEEASPPTAFAIRANVDDWSIRVPTQSYADTDLILEARLRLPGESKPSAARRTIILDGSPPELTLPARVVRVERGQDASIEVDCDDGDGVPVGDRRKGASGVDRIEWRIVTGNIGEDGGWKGVKAAKTTRILVPTTGLPIGRHEIQIRLIDKVGLKSDEHRCEIAVAEPGSSSAGERPPPTE